MADPNAKEIPSDNVDGSLAELVTQAEYSVQIATAKRYPRSVKQFMNAAMEMVTLNVCATSSAFWRVQSLGSCHYRQRCARFAD